MINDRINKINDCIFSENQNPQQKIISSLHTNEHQTTEQYFKSFKISKREEATGNFDKNQQLHLLLEYFVEDSDKCIYFPEERFINKMKLDKKRAHVIAFIEEAVKKLKIQHNEKRRSIVYLPDEKPNIVVGSIVTEMTDGLTKLITISNTLDILEINVKEIKQFYNCLMIIINKLQNKI